MIGTPYRVTFESATVRYSPSQVPAIDALNLAVLAGELLAILGPSGSGKSTLLRCVNRLAPLQSGRILLDDIDIGTLPLENLRRSIGYAIQGVGLFAHLTVAENLALLPESLHWPRTRIDSRIDELLQAVHLEPSIYRRRRPRELSGGQAQRVGLARALMAEPRLLLMDEPFGAVDPLLRPQLQSELLAVVREVGTTTLFVTHDVDEALHLGDRIAVMREGRLVALGTARALLEEPPDDFVRSLLCGDALLREYRLARLAERT
ncbi:MAG TPA: ATP-binding cassette domain-containing protein [Candidatus Dormibacteraeota bacterium]|nr:ATP-binding cassette domain-containing protein [Candidatus Dormibacteraeota bacterium]